MDLRVIGVLLLIPLLDVMLLVALAAFVPLTWLVAAVVLTAFVGLLLVRAEGRRTLGKLQRKMARGEVPTGELVDGGLLLVSGALFLTPGLVTDLVAFLLVLPPTRYPVRLGLEKYVLAPYVDSATGGFASGNVYVGGFPDDGGDDPAGGGAASYEGSTVDVGEDEYRTVGEEEHRDVDDPGDS